MTADLVFYLASAVTSLSWYSWTCQQLGQPVLPKLAKVWPRPARGQSRVVVLILKPNKRKRIG